MYAFIYEADILIYVRLYWQDCLPVVHVQALDACFAFERLCACLLWPQLQTGRPEKHSFLSCPLLCKWFCRSPGSLLWLAHTLYTDCRSFTSCQGKARVEGWGQASRAVPQQPRWGECRPFTRGLAGLSTICLLPLKNVLLSTESYAISVATQSLALTVIQPFIIQQPNYFWCQSFQGLHSPESIFIHKSVTHLILRPPKATAGSTTRW